MNIYFLCRHVVRLKFYLHTRYYIYNHFKYKNKNKIRIRKNMLSMQTEKSFSGQTFWILEDKQIIQEKIYSKLIVS